MVSSDRSSYSKRLLQLISWGHWFTFFNIIAAIFLASLYFLSEPLPETLLGSIYLITTWLSHMGFLTFICFVIALFPIILLHPKTRFIRAYGSIIFTLGIVLLLLDAYIYNQLGYHLNASSTAQIIALASSQLNDKQNVFILLAVFTVIFTFAFQLIVSNYAWKHLRRLQKAQFAKYTVSGLIAAFFFSHFLHIWADAKLDYDILRQDTVLPLSYPTTAKTLLTKYDLFDQQDYLQKRNSPLAFNELSAKYPSLTEQCAQATKINNSAFLVINANLLTEQQITQFQQRASNKSVRLNHHLDNALPNNAWFNLLYSLPSSYQSPVLASGAKPLLLQALDQQQLAKTFTIVSKETPDFNAYSWLTELMGSKSHYQNISSLIFPDKLVHYPAGLHIIYFQDDNNYQYELFIDALLHSQAYKAEKDFIWISSIGNNTATSQFAIKPSLLVLPNKLNKEVHNITSQMDVQLTLFSQWLACQSNKSDFPNGTDLVTLKHDRIIANTVANGIMVFNKDKSVFIDENGNFQSYSRQLSAPITVSADLPLMIDGVNFIKQFVKNSANEQ